MPLSQEAPALDTIYPASAYPGITPEQRVERFESLKKAFKSNIARCEQNKRMGLRFDKSAGSWFDARGDGSYELRQQLESQIEKAATPDLKASLASALAEINKEWTTTNPLSVAPFNGLDMGLVPYNLEDTLIALLPRFLGLRSSIPRTQGVGTAVEFRRLRGVTNTGTDSIADSPPFFNSESADTTVGSLSLLIPPMINYGADRVVVPYCEQGYSDMVSYKAFRTGQGYVDLQTLSHISLTLADMIGEEKAILNSRGGGSNFLGALNVTSITASCSASSGSGMGAHTYTVQVTFVSSTGETAPISASTCTTSGGNEQVTVTVSAIPSGTLSAWVYFSTNSGTSYTAVNVGGASTLVAGVAFASAGATRVLPTEDASAYGISGGVYPNAGYDGLVAQYTGSNAGYVNRVDGNMSTSNPGTEIQTVLLNLYNSVLAQPDELWTTASIRQRIFQIIQSNGSTLAWRIAFDPTGGTIGGFVADYADQISGRTLPISVHPYMPAGVILARSKSVPNAGVTGITNLQEIQNVVDTTIFDWPDIQLAHVISTYRLGALIERGPMYSGSCVGITG